MAEGDPIELPAASCTSDDHNVELEPQSDLPLSKVNALSVAELKLEDAREPLSSPPQSNNSITPVPISIPAEEKHAAGDGTDVQVASSIVLPNNIGVRVLLKEIKCLAHRVEFVEAVVEPLKRHDGAPAVDDGTAADAQSAGRQPAVGMAHELKQSIKESAELIRTINGDFSRLGEKLNEWIPVVDKKVTASIL